MSSSFNFDPSNKPDGDYPTPSDLVLVVKDGKVIGYRGEGGKLGIFPAYMETDAPPAEGFQLPPLDLSEALPPVLDYASGDNPTMLIGIDPAAPGGDHTYLGTPLIPFEMTEASLPGWEGMPTDTPEGYLREYTRRTNEPQPDNPRLIYRPGDKVKTTRRDLLNIVPVGAVGEIKRLEHPAHMMSVLNRPYVVWFDVRSFNIPTPPDWKATNRPERLEFIENNCGANDLELVEKGDNWGADYQFPHRLDAIEWAAAHMSPADWHTTLTRITEGIIRKNPDLSHDYFLGKRPADIDPAPTVPGASSSWPFPFPELTADSDLTQIGEKELGAVQDWLEQIPIETGWTDKQDRLHLEIVREWGRREALELPPEPTDLNQLPPDSE